MKVLLTNDDGLFTNGLLHLEQALASFGEIWCIAPDRERSATSQALSLRETLLLKEVSPRKFTVNGYPTDCVNLALFTEDFPAFDLVVSGINHGVNLGDDIHYSGTVGAARHAALHGKKAIAISAPIRPHDGDFRRPAAWLAKWLETNLENFPQRVLWNINYPLEARANAGDPFPGMRWTRQGRRIYKDAYELLEEGAGGKLYKLLETEMGWHDDAESDCRAFEDGMISITPLALDTTAVTIEPVSR
ncbi:MAG: 5'/3'-nucleotidase SurE [Leptospirales bacterium]|nr:5'/3'-nucleotidase SurE [Leptospirales bacterium]